MNGTERSPAGNSPLAELDRDVLALAMRAEAGDIAARRPDIVKPAGIPVVVVDIPAELTSGAMQIAVHHRVWGEVEVDIRADHHRTWTPIRLVGGDFDVRPA